MPISKVIFYTSMSALYLIGKTRKRFMGRLARIAVVGLTIMSLVITVSPQSAEAGLAFVGPVSEQTGFPVWYKDENGIALDLMEGADAFGISEPIDPENPFSEQIGFGAEGFWWSAEAEAVGDGIDALVVNAMEAAFAGEAAVDGEQSAFGRVRFRIDVPVVGEYTVKHPYGVEHFTVD